MKTNQGYLIKNKHRFPSSCYRFLGRFSTWGIKISLTKKQNKNTSKQHIPAHVKNLFLNENN
jgi:hypothetical protein